MPDTLKYTYTRKIYPRKNDKSVVVKMRYFKRDVPKKVVEIIGSPKTVNFSLHTNSDAVVRRFQPKLLKLFEASCEAAMKTKQWMFDPSKVIGTKIDSGVSKAKSLSSPVSEEEEQDSPELQLIDLPSFDGAKTKKVRSEDVLIVQRGIDSPRIEQPSTHIPSDFDIQGQLEKRRPETLEELIVLFLKVKKSVWTTDKTFTQYSHALKLLYRLTLPSTLISYITPHRVTGWLPDILKDWINDKRSKATIRGYIINGRHCGNGQLLKTMLLRTLGLNWMLKTKDIKGR